MASDEEDRAARTAQLFRQMAATGREYSPATTALVVVDGESSHVQISIPYEEHTPADVYLAGQKAIWALTVFLENYRPHVEAAERQKAQSS